MQGAAAVGSAPPGFTHRDGGGGAVHLVADPPGEDTPAETRAAPPEDASARAQPAEPQPEVGGTEKPGVLGDDGDQAAEALEEARAREQEQDVEARGGGETPSGLAASVHGGGAPPGNISEIKPAVAEEEPAGGGVAGLRGGGGELGLTPHRW